MAAGPRNASRLMDFRSSCGKETFLKRNVNTKGVNGMDMFCTGCPGLTWSQLDRKSVKILESEEVLRVKVWDAICLEDSSSNSKLFSNGPVTRMYKFYRKNGYV